MSIHKILNFEKGHVGNAEIWQYLTFTADSINWINMYHHAKFRSDRSNR